MKKFFIFGLFLCFSGALSAQSLDDLFDESDFASEPGAEEKAKTAAPKPVDTKSAKPVAPAPSSAKAAPVSAAVPMPVPSQSQPAQAQPSGSQSAPASVGSRGIPRTFDVPKSSPSALTLPYSGGASEPAETIAPSTGAGLLSRLAADSPAPDLPMLGARAKAKEEKENLSLFERRRREIGDSDINVESFDIAGMMLGMTPADIMEVATANGFSVKFQNRKIPPFLQWKYKKECLKETAFSYAALKQCIRETAWKSQEEYISRLQFEKPEMKEKIVVEFTSTFGGNQAYRIHYVSKGDHSLGSTSEARYQKSRRRRDFLYAVMQKYGQPDDEDALLWGMKDEGAYLEADISPALMDVSLTLENMDLTDEDSDNMFLADKKDGLGNKFSF